ncbi:helix-turn-helix domain-containing protein [Desulfolucanica intricata]|uniref:helix-turn-helix domain-containing protein n=1 Tax=Desulfolucanica intricata TaxID=1285191 RepID=UPI000B2BC901|nr:helix-turn-helix domain-containing protein [Desulfolucanica intricata]
MSLGETIEDLSAKVAEHRKKIERKTLTVKELAKVLGVSEKKARRLTHAKDFPVLVLGQTRLTIISKLDDWLENNIGKIF